MDLLYVLAALVAIAALQAWLVRAFGLRGVTYRRSFSQKSAFAGEEVRMVEVLRNAKPLPLPWLRAESRMAAALRFPERAKDGGTHAMDEDSLFHRSVFFLAPFSQVTRTHRVTLLRRGHYAVGSVALTVGDLFGLSFASAELDTGASIDVYPRLLPLESAQLPASRMLGDLLVKRWIVPDPFLVAGIREWQHGDARRDVHWAATARTGRLQVKAHDYTAEPRLLVVLNVQRDEEQWGDLMDYEQPVIEHGLSIAATLCVHALAAGLEAGFAANAPTGDGSNTTLLMPARAAGLDTALLTAMARLRIVRARNFYTFLEDLLALTGQDMLILSAYDSPRIQQRMAMLRMRGNSVSLQLLPKEVPA